MGAESRCVRIEGKNLCVLEPRVRCKNKKLQKILNRVFGFKMILITEIKDFEIKGVIER